MSGDCKMQKRATIVIAGGLDRLEQMIAICRAQGGRVTAQRRAVLAELVAGIHPLSAYQLLARLKRDDMAATPARIYRCLDFLLRHGMVRRLEATKSYVACGNPRNAAALQFLICRACGTVTEAEDERVKAATRRLGDRLRFAVELHTIELTGVCRPCRGRSTC